MRSLAAVALVMVLAACSHDHDDHPHAARPAICEEIGERCHAFETTSAIAKECHESAHATWTEAQCTAKRAECFAACTVSDAATSG
jgi:hypothetical protein